jgi:hypothetical protein
MPAPKCYTTSLLKKKRELKKQGAFMAVDQKSKEALKEKRRKSRSTLLKPAARKEKAKPKAQKKATPKTKATPKVDSGLTAAVQHGKVNLTKLVVDAFFGSNRQLWLGISDFCLKLSKPKSKKYPLAITRNLSFFRELALKTKSAPMKPEETARDYCQRVVYHADYPTMWELLTKNLRLIPTLTANQQVKQLQKQGRILLMLPFWHMVLTQSWNDASPKQKVEIRGKNGQNIELQLEALQTLKNNLHVFYSLRGSVGLAEYLSPRVLLPAFVGGRKARTSYFLGRVSKQNMKVLESMLACVTQISMLVEFNGGMISQLKTDKDVAYWYFKVDEQKRENEKLQIKRRELWLKEQQNTREMAATARLQKKSEEDKKQVKTTRSTASMFVRFSDS